MNLKAFTVIELLVVISILGLLASVVLLSMEGATDRAVIGKAMEFSHVTRVSLGADLVGEWRFNETAGIEAKDSSGDDNHGTLISDGDLPEWTSGGVFNNALVFDGTDEHVCIENFNYNVLKQGHESGSWTLEAWAKPNGAQVSNERMIVGRSGWHGGVSVGTNNLRFAIWNTTPSSIAINYTPPNMESWYHLVAVYDNRDMFFHVNGELVGTASFSGTIRPYDNTLYIGACGGHDFNGVIDEVRVYEQALSTAEIKQLYAQGAANHNIVLK